MRRRDKEIIDRNVIEAIFNSASLIRLGFMNDRKAKIVPAVFSLDNGQILVDKDIFVGSVSFETHVYGGIKRGERICSFSTKYMSIMGHGAIYNGKLSIETLSAKVSAMSMAEMPAKAYPLKVEEGFLDYSLVESINLGLPSGHKFYIMPVNHVVWNGAIYFHSAKEGQKIELLKSLPEIVIEGELFNGGVIYSQRNVKPVIVESPEEKSSAMSAISKKFSGGDFTFAPESLNKIEIVKLS